MHHSAGFELYHMTIRTVIKYPYQLQYTLNRAYFKGAGRVCSAPQTSNPDLPNSAVAICSGVTLLFYNNHLFLSRLLV